MSSWVRPRQRPEPPLDRRAQSERTAMAWQRTALGVGGIGALLLHSGVPLAAVLGAGGLLTAVTLLFVAEGRYERTVARVERGEPSSSPALMRAMTITVMLLSVGAIVLVILPSR